MYSKKLKYLEIPVFICGLILLAMMDPGNSGTTLCLLEHLGYPYCPGEGIGHSIAYFFRGDINSSLEANFMGPFAVVILTFRIIYLFREYYKEQKRFKEEIDG